ncbi:MAG: hypothetical protein VKL39_16420 [Leptolyngbyaceae bacterium]|nr:hypothetical protein [Leptolyngbyaceae bacterium]
MSVAIVAKSDQLNSDDLIGGAITIKITKVTISESADQKVSINYEGDNGKPYKPCKSMCRVLVNAWGADGAAYVGRSLTVFRDPDVTWAGMKVGGIRISHMSHIDGTLNMALTSTRGKKSGYQVKPLKIDQKPVKSVNAIPDTTVEKILGFGAEAASKGVAAYTAWLAPLSAEVKDNIKHMHKEWSAIAREADKNKEDDIPL